MLWQLRLRKVSSGSGLAYTPNTINWFSDLIARYTHERETHAPRRAVEGTGRGKGKVLPAARRGALALHLTTGY